MGEILPFEVAQAMRDPKRILGKYILLQQVGKGGMGTVYKAWQLDLKRFVAIKFLLQTEPDDLKRFYREAQSVAKLNHPNIAAIHEVCIENEKPFIVMDFVEGTTLDKLIRARKDPTTKLARYVRDAALGLNHAHLHGIVHRDVKPSNIMVTPKERVYVMDFGLAKSVKSDTRVTQTGMIVGTPSYLSPEQAAGDASKIDRRADIWSLGATLYEAISGRPPFTGKTAVDTVISVVHDDPQPPTKFAPTTPRELESISLKCLEKDRTRRYPSAKHLADDLSRFLSGLQVTAKPQTAFDRAGRKVRRHKKLTLGIAGAALAIAAALTYAIAQRSENTQLKEHTQQTDAARNEAKDAMAKATTLWKSLMYSTDMIVVPKGLTEAAQLAKKAHAMLIDSDEPAQLVGSIALARGDLSAAMDWLGKAIERNPRSWLAHYDRARAIAYYLMLREYLLKPNAKQELLNLAKSDIEALKSGGLVNPNQQKFMDAVQAYLSNDIVKSSATLDALLKQDPNDADTHLLRALCCMVLMQDWPAYTHLRLALDHSPNLVVTIIYLGRIAAKLKQTVKPIDGDMELIHKALQRAHDLNPTSVELLRAGALLLLATREDPKSGIDQLRQALSLEADNWLVMQDLADALGGDEELISKSERLIPDRDYAKYLKAKRLLNIGHYREAESLLKEALQTPGLPSDRRGQYKIELARSYMLSSDWILAYDTAEDALKDNPMLPSADVVAAYALYQNNKCEKGYNRARKAIYQDEEAFNLDIHTRATAHAIAGLCYAFMKRGQALSPEDRKAILDDFKLAEQWKCFDFVAEQIRPVSERVKATE